MDKARVTEIGSMDLEQQLQFLILLYLIFMTCIILITASQICININMFIT